MVDYSLGYIKECAINGTEMGSKSTVKVAARYHLGSISQHSTVKAQIVARTKIKPDAEGFSLNIGHQAVRVAIWLY